MLDRQRCMDIVSFYIVAYITQRCTDGNLPHSTSLQTGRLNNTPLKVISAYFDSVTEARDIPDPIARHFVSVRQQMPDRNRRIQAKSKA